MKSLFFLFIVFGWVSAQAGELADAFKAEAAARAARQREKSERESQRWLNSKLNGLATRCGTKALGYEEANRNDAAMTDGENVLMKGYYVHFANGRVGFIGFDFGEGTKTDCGN